MINTVFNTTKNISTYLYNYYNSWACLWVYINHDTFSVILIHITGYWYMHISSSQFIVFLYMS